MLPTNRNKKMIKNILENLKTDKTQRIVYSFGLLLWLFVWSDNFQFINGETFVIYLIQILLPLFFITIQIFYNNKVIWKILFIYSIIYSLWIINNVFSDISREMNRDYAPYPNLFVGQIRIWIILGSIILIVNWIIWKIKPIKNTL
jgi:hypothetical protein